MRETVRESRDSKEESTEISRRRARIWVEGLNEVLRWPEHGSTGFMYISLYVSGVRQI